MWNQPNQRDWEQIPQQEMEQTCITQQAKQTRLLFQLWWALFNGNSLVDTRLLR